MPEYKIGKRVQYVTWYSGVQKLHAAPQTDDAEAWAAMKALAAPFLCSQCGGMLDESNGYECCFWVHCPLCGVAAGQVSAYWLNGHCEHLVLYRRFNTSLLRLGRAKMDPPALREQVEASLALPAPASGDGGESPAWSDAQIREAYGPKLALAARQVWGPELRALDPEQMCRTLLSTCLLPDMKTTSYDSKRRHYEFYFCSNRDAALSRVLTWANAMRDGTCRLQAMPPQPITVT